ncbi:hypothetical protein QBC43DRAFT_358460 [Cladorrhinum sp. PSN259]|nr:hypothetical protein QBC43DRAFT_358460 [Cladorrhinum sp. PSN259]
MFYSHEILTSRQYGVATVWLVSTVGIRSNTGNRKISRKDVEQVNVPKACETILQPAAPIALRLQGSLLYGLSRVYSQQCHYVLTDAEKVQAHMMAFYNTLGGNKNALDYKAGKAKRNELILLDDPNFDLTENFNLPVFDFDDEGNLVVPDISQASRKVSSQLSPLERAASSASGSFHGVLNLPASSGGNSPFFDDPLAKNMYLDQGYDTIKPFGEEEQEIDVLDDWGIEIDADGNIIEEPELPQIPKSQLSKHGNSIHSDLPIPFSDSIGDIPMGGTDPFLPSDPPIPSREEQQEHQPQQQEQEQEQEQQEVAMNNQQNAVVQQAPVRVRRQRQRRVLAPDNQTSFSKDVLRDWNANYLDYVTPAPFPGYGATPAEARHNAFNLIFGRGIANVGHAADGHNIFNPMAAHFAGHALQVQILGIACYSADLEDGEAPRGRRRIASEALELVEEESARRVRPRLSSQAAQVIPRPEENEPAIEAGRDAGSALPDLPSDVPWNRPSSQIPSSSMKGAAGQGSRAGSRQVSASPLVGRSHGLDAIERFSDQPIFGSDGFGDFLPSQGNDAFSSDLAAPPDFPDVPRRDESVVVNTSQAMLNALDREGRSFHAFIQTMAKDRGYPKDNDTEVSRARQWVDFDQLFESEDRNRAVIAQAFHHVLSLATKNIIKVEQEGQGGTEPFGTIRVGVGIPDHNDDDEEQGENEGGYDDVVAWGDY